MPWRDLLSSTQRVQVMALPTSLREYEELYTLTPADLDFVAVHRCSDGDSELLRGTEDSRVRFRMAAAYLAWGFR